MLRRVAAADLRLLQAMIRFAAGPRRRPRLLRRILIKLASQPGHPRPARYGWLSSKIACIQNSRRINI